MNFVTSFFIGCFFMLLNFLTNFLTPFYIGVYFSTLNGNVGKIEIIIKGIFNLLQRTGYIFKKLYEGVRFCFYKGYNFILSKLNMENINLSEIEQDETSIKTMINVFISIFIITIIYLFIGDYMFSGISEEVEEAILGKLTGGTLTSKLITIIIVGGGNILKTLVTTKNWYLLLPIFFIITVLYSAIIYNGLIEIGQINRQDRNIFKVKVLNISNIIKIVGVIAFISFIMNIVPSFDFISAIFIVKNAFNIEFNFTSIVTVATPITSVKVIKVGTEVISNIINNNSGGGNTGGGQASQNMNKMNIFNK